MGQTISFSLLSVSDFTGSVCARMHAHAPARVGEGTCVYVCVYLVIWNPAPGQQDLKMTMEIAAK